MQTTPIYQVDGLTFTGIISLLTGAIGLLFRMLIAAKDSVIASKDAEIKNLIATKDAEIRNITDERDFYRDAWRQLLSTAERSAGVAEEATQVAGHALSRGRSR